MSKFLTYENDVKHTSGAGLYSLYFFDNLLGTMIYHNGTGLWLKRNILTEKISIATMNRTKFQWLNLESELHISLIINFLTTYITA